MSGGLDRPVIDQHGKEWMIVHVQDYRCMLINERNEYIWAWAEDLPGGRVRVDKELAETKERAARL